MFTGCLLDYVYFEIEMIEIEMIEEELDSDQKAIQQITFTRNLDRAGNITMFFIIKEAKEIILNSSQGNVRE